MPAVQGASSGATMYIDCDDHGVCNAATLSCGAGRVELHPGPLRPSPRCSWSTGQHGHCPYTWQNADGPHAEPACLLVLYLSLKGEFIRVSE